MFGAGARCTQQSPPACLKVDEYWDTDGWDVICSKTLEFDFGYAYGYRSLRGWAKGGSKGRGGMEGGM